MQRYFIQPSQIENKIIRLTEDVAHHLTHVLRSRLDDQLICCDGLGSDYITKIIEISKGTVLCEILETRPSQGEPLTQVTIAQSFPKGDKWEWILQKGTEIGAVRFLPFQSERTVVKIDARKAVKKQERWERIVQEAAEQAHRGRVPEVGAVLSWKDLLREIRSSSTSWIAYEKGGEALSEEIASSSDDILLIIGPEGGFSESEVQEAIEAGAKPITLGKRILRTETAPLAALSCILFARNDFGR
ncbi:16S rRNA (uracil(1498)-N(3))-methyltransferase [Hazenella coriacea]|uniref:Ribosomal RNA small subunit methyltransferase E n=1 Tax=Hazenella coriacea TaxID=1179467 RepID=A0A4R3L4R1_9BACL|nr:16S rRNA (uracil(1498)-N(3))-methyltransferase [Hazenella coriacea]TCS94771.1 16S rRNA (uracil1498-N3)-methyltransferase [Hazenella coriacea]